MTDAPLGRAASGSGSGILAFLFTDLAGSTRLWEELPGPMSVALRRHDAILGEAITSAGGQVVKSTGDGIMAVFPHAADGVAASIAAQRSLAREAWRETGPLKVRMGIHAGEAERRGNDFFGPTLNRAARIMAAGHGGQVLLSSTAAALALDRLPPAADLRDLGEQRLKDIGRPERVFQVVHPDLDAAFPPLVTSELAYAALPVQAATLVGRSVELAAIAARLADPAIRLLTLTGPGGTGKTSLAVRAAADATPAFPDGVAFVDLSAARGTDAVLGEIGRAIGVGDPGDRTQLEALAERLRTGTRLLVLDNFEQVTAAAGAVAGLLSGAPSLRLLVTSRERLHVRAEHVYAVPPLGVPGEGERVVTAARAAEYEAVALFVARARDVRPGFELTDEDTPAVVEICRRLDGLPLAIELAAARLRLFSLQSLLERLGRGVDVLRSSSRDMPERQQTIRATIEWSYELLDPPEQRLFEALSVFADADVEAIVAVERRAAGDEDDDDWDGDGGDTLDHLESLIAKNLVRRIEATHGEPRVGMLKTIREYATERLDADPARADRVRRAHATWYTDLASRCRRDLVSSDRDDAVHQLSAEAENLRAAWRCWVGARDLERLNELAGSLLLLNEARGWYRDTVVLATDLLAVLETEAASPERLSQEVSLRVTLARALMATEGYTPEVEDAYIRALELFEGSEAGSSTRQQASILRALASVYMLRSQFEKSAQLGARILELAEHEQDPAMLVDGHLVVGSTQVFGTQIADGLRHLDLAIAAVADHPRRPLGFRMGNDPLVACYTTSGLGLWLAGFPDQARGRLTSAVELAATLDHPFTRAFAHFHSGLLHVWMREPDRALERAVTVLEVADDHDLAIWSAVGTCLLGVAQAALGLGDAGLAAVRSGMALYGGLRTPPVFWPMLQFVEAIAALHAGRPDEGLTPIRSAIELSGGADGAVIVPELWILEGDLLGAMAEPGGPEPGEALERYRWALDRSTTLGSRLSQLRAATRLAQADPGDAAAAHRLAAILATVDEGFETRDLMEARALVG